MSNMQEYLLNATFPFLYSNTELGSCPGRLYESVWAQQKTGNNFPQVCCKTLQMMGKGQRLDPSLWALPHLPTLFLLCLSYAPRFSVGQHLLSTVKILPLLFWRLTLRTMPND